MRIVITREEFYPSIPLMCMLWYRAVADIWTSRKKIDDL